MKPRAPVLSRSQLAEGWTPTDRREQFRVAPYRGHISAISFSSWSALLPPARRNRRAGCPLRLFRGRRKLALDLPAKPEGKARMTLPKQIGAPLFHRGGRPGGALDRHSRHIAWRSLGQPTAVSLPALAASAARPLSRIDDAHAPPDQLTSRSIGAPRPGPVLSPAPAALRLYAWSPSTASCATNGQNIIVNSLSQAQTAPSETYDLYLLRVV